MLRWHRRFGLAAALLVLILAITGILLARSDRLGLDRAMVTSPVVLSWYRLAPAGTPVSFAAGDHWITILDGFVYRDGEPAGEDIGHLVGAVMVAGRIVLASADRLHLVDADGTLGAPVKIGLLQGQIAAIGVAGEGSVAIRTSKATFVSADTLRQWRVYTGAVSWSQPETPPDDILDMVRASHGPDGLPASRLMLDLHSGRLFGAWGPYLMDAAAIFLILLTASGVYNWWAGRRR